MRLTFLLPAFILVIAGCSSSEIATSPSPVKCQLTLTAPQGSVPAAGGTGTISIATTAECAWTASSSVNWITGLTPASGQGSGTLQFQVAANPGSTSRSGNIRLNDAAAPVTQAGSSCDISLNPSSNQQVAQTGGTGAVSVSAPDGCAWIAESADSWIVVTSGSSGNGNGTVAYSVSANGGATRSGSLLIGGQSFAVTQQGVGAPACQPALQPAALSIAAGGGTASVAVSTAPGCSWTVVSQAPWLSVVGQGAGVGNGSTTISVAANTGSTRVGTVAIAGLTLQVTQAGNCSVAIGSASQLVGAAGGQASPVSVTANAGCTWTATTTQPWISVTSGATGSGNGAVDFTVAANTGPVRTGTLTIGGQTHTVTQADGCSIAIGSASQLVGAAGGQASPVSVTANAGCTWTATTTQPWISVTSGATGSGNGAVDFTVAANTGSVRTGTLTIGGQTHTVTQAGNCSIAIGSASQLVGAAGGQASPVSVTANAGCTWTATTTQPWISVTSGATGSGNGAVDFTVAANTGPVRTGTLTIGGQTHTVTQADGCSFSLSQTSLHFTSDDATSTPIGVTAGAGCAWTATSNASWITIDSGASGTGSGSVVFSVTRNNGNSIRSGTLTIAGLTFTVTQDKK